MPTLTPPPTLTPLHRELDFQDIAQPFEQVGKRKRILSLYRPVALGLVFALAAGLILIVTMVLFPLQNPVYQRDSYVRYGNLLPLKVAELDRHAARPEVLFLGTSQTNNGFATQAFENAAPGVITSFNMGLPNNQYEMMLGYLKLHVASHGKPQKLLVDLSPTILAKTSPHYGKQTRIYRMIEDKPWIPQAAKRTLYLFMFSAAGTLNQFRQELSPLASLSRSMGEEEMSTTTVGWTPEMVHGWTPKPENPLMRTPEGRQKVLLETRKYFLDKLPPINFSKLHTLLTYCREERIPVVLVTWPNHPEFLELMKRSGVYQTFRQGALLTSEAYQIPWIDLNHRSQGSLEGVYSDPRHLTPKGANLYSKLLATEVFN